MGNVKKKNDIKEKEAEIIHTICGNCRFWHEVSPVEDDVNECRRNAPAPGLGQPMLKWPMTKGSVWCGEFKGK